MRRIKSGAALVALFVVASFTGCNTVFEQNDIEAVQTSWQEIRVDYDSMVQTSDMSEQQKERRLTLSRTHQELLDAIEERSK